MTAIGGSDAALALVIALAGVGAAAGALRRRAPGGVALLLLGAVAAFWALASRLPGTRPWGDAAVPAAAALLPGLWAWFALRHARRRAPWFAVGALLLPGAATLVLGSTWGAAVDPTGATARWILAVVGGAIVGVATVALVRPRPDGGVGAASVALAAAGVAPALTAALTLPWAASAGPWIPAALALALVTVAVVMERQAAAAATAAGYRGAFAEVPDGLVWVDARGSVLDLNPAAERVLGVPRAAALRRPLSAALPALARSGDRAPDLRAEVDGVPRVYQVRDHGRAGDAGRVMVLHDVTGARTSEEALARRAAVLAAVEEASRSLLRGASMAEVRDALLAGLGVALDAQRAVLVELPPRSGVRPDQERGTTPPTVLCRWETLDAAPWPGDGVPYSSALLTRGLEGAGFAGTRAELPAQDRDAFAPPALGYALLLPVHDRSGTVQQLAMEWADPVPSWLPLVADGVRAAPAMLEAAAERARGARLGEAAEATRAALLELAREPLETADGPSFYVRLLALAVARVPGVTRAALWLRAEDGTFRLVAAEGAEGTAAVGELGPDVLSAEEAGSSAGAGGGAEVALVGPEAGSGAAGGAERWDGSEHGPDLGGDGERDGGSGPASAADPWGAPPDALLAAPVWVDGRLEATLRLGGPDPDALADAAPLAEAVAAQLGAWVRRLRHEQDGDVAARTGMLLADLERLLASHDRARGIFPMLARHLLGEADLGFVRLAVVRFGGDAAEGDAAEGGEVEVFDPEGERDPAWERRLRGADGRPLEALAGLVGADAPVFEPGPSQTLPAPRWVALPVSVLGRPWGVCVFLGDVPRPIDPSLRAVATRVAAALEVTLLRLEDRRRLALERDRLAALVTVHEELRAASRRRDVVTRSLEAVLRMIAADVAALLLFDAREGALRVAARRLRRAPAVASSAASWQAARGTVAWRAFEDGAAATRRDPAGLGAAGRVAPGGEPVEVLAVPLRNRDAEVVGVVVVSHGDPGRRLDAGDRELLDAVAIACGTALDRLALLDASRTQAERYRELYDRAERRARELRLLDRVRDEVLGELEVTRLYPACARAIAEVLGYGPVEIYRADGGVLALRERVEAGGAAGEIPLGAPPLVPGRGAWGEAVTGSGAARVARADGAHEVIAPVRAHGALVAALRVGGGDGLDEDDRRVVAAVADQLGAAVERAELYSAVKQSEERFRLLAEHTTDVVCLHDADGRFRYVSPSAHAVLGYAPEELLGRDPYAYNHHEDRERVREGAHQRLLAGAPSMRYTVRFRHRDGHYVWLETTASAVFDGDGAVLALVTSSRDVGERMRMEERLLHGALFDGLTGLPNRALLFDRLEHALARADRDETVRFAVLFLDLDRFKIVNDSLGHHAGDELLKALATRLKACVRGSDTVARLGGDEFCILLEDARRDDATVTATRIQRSLAEAFVLDGHDIFTSASIGIAFSAPHYREPQELLRDADIAMYRAKAAGKARHAVFDESMHAQAFNQMELETSLHRALEREELTLQYQPVVALATGRIVGVEALLRWRHPTRGELSPHDFLPLAEESGRIVAIDRWVVRRAVAQVRDWQARVPDAAPQFLSVNVSARHLSLGDVEALLSDGLEGEPLEPGRLKLELTEAALMGNPLAAAEVLSELRGRGVAVQVDDFGTGYSSLSYLHRLPIDSLKIDRAFVHQLDTSDLNRAIVTSIVRLAESLGIGVVAEGVERPEEAAALVALGCRLGQGYLFHPPLSPDEMPQRLRAMPRA